MEATPDNSSSDPDDYQPRLNRLQKIWEMLREQVDENAEFQPEEPHDPEVYDQWFKDHPRPKR